MQIYNKDQILSLIKLEIKDGSKTFTADLLTIENLIIKGRITKEDLIATHYRLKVTGIIEHKHDYFGYEGVLTERYVGNTYEPIEGIKITLNCQKDYYERHPFFVAGLTLDNISDYYWTFEKPDNNDEKLLRIIENYNGVYYTANNFVKNILIEHEMDYLFLNTGN